MADSEELARADAVLTNPQGLHARPSSLIVKRAAMYRSRVVLRVGDLEADASSIMEVIMLASPVGSRIEIEARGADAADAVEAVRALIASGFGEEK